jgi:hypothetical protein
MTDLFRIDGIPIGILIASLVIITLALPGVQPVIAQDATLDRWLTWSPTKRLEVATAGLAAMKGNGVVCPAALDATYVEWLVSGAARGVTSAESKVVTISQSLGIIFQQAGCRASR